MGSSYLASLDFSLVRSVAGRLDILATVIKVQLGGEGFVLSTRFPVSVFRTNYLIKVMLRRTLMILRPQTSSNWRWYRINCWDQ